MYLAAIGPKPKADNNHQNPIHLLGKDLRASLMPNACKKLIAQGIQVGVQKDLGLNFDLADQAYLDVGCEVLTKEELFKKADWVVSLNPPTDSDFELFLPEQKYLGFLDPFFNPQNITKLSQKKVTAVAMELIPRSTIAQKMDALSSQASLAGYQAVILAAQYLPKILPMMVTPSGTISPARFLIIGAGVAGLQAIATAKRLGARVEAFDTRPVVKEQVESLGAKFIEIDLGDTGQTKQGYAKALTEEQIKKQREELTKYLAKADVVITTAQVFGKKAPLIVTEEMLDGMTAGSLVVDLAIETGGNVVFAKLGEVVNRNGVRILGQGFFSAMVAYDASEMYANNIAHFILHFWDKETKELNLDRQDEIIQSALVLDKGVLLKEQFQTTKTS